MINVDSFLKKGKQHFICEDYIINSDDRDTMPYIILSDGCSSSENTDIGSRVLVRSALNILDEKLDIEFKFRSCNRFGKCSPCDLKIKNNRFQEFGACSVKVIDG